MALSKNSRQARMAGVQLERESKQEAWGLKGGQELATQGQGGKGLKQAFWLGHLEDAGMS